MADPWSQKILGGSRKQRIIMLKQPRDGPGQIPLGKSQINGAAFCYVGAPVFMFVFFIGGLPLQELRSS